MSFEFDRTTPRHSRWDQDGAEYVRSDSDWVRRCAKRLVDANRYLEPLQAQSLAVDLSSDDNLRALSPERVAEDLMQVELGLD